MESPKVSVLMTAYNREKYIAEAIESVLASTFKDFELIIVDDCSTDKTVEIASTYPVKDQRVRLYINKENLGDYPNRNKAASYAKGEFLVSVDSDDKLFPDSMKYIVEGFSLHPEVNFGIIDSDCNSLHLVQNFYQIKNQEASIKEHFFTRPSLIRGPGGSVIRKDFFDKIGGFPVLYGPANDMFYNLKAASNTTTLFFGYHFLFYRIHTEQERNNEKSYIINNFKYLKDFISYTDKILSTKEKETILKNNSRRFVLNTIRYLIQKKSINDFWKFYKEVNFSFVDIKALIK